MKELKFRAWNRAFNKMEYKVNLYSLNKEGKIDKAQLGQEQYMRTIGFDCRVMQFTGAVDKNGKEIYEGDILKYWGGVNIVVFHNYEYCIKYTEHDYFNIESERVEVLGNVYENHNIEISKPQT